MGVIVNLAAMMSKKVPSDPSASGDVCRIQPLFITVAWAPQNIELSTWGGPGGL